MERLKTSNVSISNSSTEEFWCQILRKLIFRSGIYVTIADADIRNLKSLHTLFGKYLDHMLVNVEKIVWSETIQNFVLFDKKMVNNCWQSVDAILEDVSVTETIVWC